MRIVTQGGVIHEGQFSNGHVLGVVRTINEDGTFQIAQCMNNKPHGYLNRFGFNELGELMVSVTMFERGEKKPRSVSDIVASIGEFMAKHKRTDTGGMLKETLKKCTLDCLDKQGLGDTYSDKAFDAKFERFAEAQAYEATDRLCSSEDILNFIKEMLKC